MQAGVSTVDSVIAVRISKEVKVLSSCHERIDHFHGVLEMNIVIRRAVHQ